AVQRNPKEELQRPPPADTFTESDDAVSVSWTSIARPLEQPHPMAGAKCIARTVHPKLSRKALPTRPLTTSREISDHEITSTDSPLKAAIFCRCTVSTSTFVHSGSQWKWGWCVGRAGPLCSKL
ncbi:hypothetical protein Vafri_3572, partial [Volvox africanus]